MPCIFAIRVILELNNPGKQTPLLDIILKSPEAFAATEFNAIFSDDFYATKPPAHPEDGDGNSSRNVVKPSHLDAAVCLRKVHLLTIRYTIYSLKAIGLTPRGSSTVHI
jgi:hypothetical protein